MKNTSLFFKGIINVLRQDSLGWNSSASFAKTKRQKAPKLVPLRKSAALWRGVWQSHKPSAWEASREVAVYWPGRGADRWEDMDQQQEAVDYGGGGVITPLSAAPVVAALRLWAVATGIKIDKRVASQLQITSWCVKTKRRGREEGLLIGKILSRSLSFR